MRVAAVGLVLLVAAVVLGWSPLIPASIVAVAGVYAAQLAIDDASLDSLAPVYAAGLLVTAELAYWSLEERESLRGEPGAGLRHATFVAGLGLATLVVGGILLAAVDAVRASGLALDLAGAAAAAGALAAIVLAARARDTRASG